MVQHHIKKVTNHYLGFIPSSQAQFNIRKSMYYTTLMKVKNLGFPGGSAGKKSACNLGDLGSIPGLGRSPGEENGYPLQYSGLKKSMD